MRGKARLVALEKRLEASRGVCAACGGLPGVMVRTVADWGERPPPCWRCGNLAVEVELRATKSRGEIEADAVREFADYPRQLEVLLANPDDAELEAMVHYSDSLRLLWSGRLGRPPERHGGDMNLYQENE